MDLVHCIYCSASAEPRLDRQGLAEILEVSRRNNAKLGITGILLYHNGSFFQVLEGERAVVEALFEKIAADGRHLRIVKIVVEPIPERAFEAWTMGYPELTAQELADIPGLNDFFRRGTSYLDIGEGRAKMLVEAFKRGRWRQAIS